MSAWLELDSVTVKHRERGGDRELVAVDRVAFQLDRGGSAALVGESGSGKSTLARALVGLHPLAGGTIRFEGNDVSKLDAAGRKAFARRVQLVFQDPYGSLDPLLAVERIVTEPLEIHGIGDARSRRARAFALLEAVGLSTLDVARYPHEFSGGQRQRIAIARALALEPELLILDEPTSALDVSVQAQVLNLLADLRDRFQLTYLFVAHDLSLVRQMCERIAVLYYGRLVEDARTDAFFRAPAHPYSRALLALARREPDAPARLVPAEAPAPFAPPSGCLFHPRCPRRAEVGARCSEERPELRLLPGESAGSVACHLDATEPAG